MTELDDDEARRDAERHELALILEKEGFMLEACPQCDEIADLTLDPSTNEVLCGFCGVKFPA